ncbi:unnamed protein product [Rotaria sp. Silwood1]|nr:unnamed protein product [Rotaria sp. Silwood1]CAF1637440.1 unnamed protein product [Rotaria sp. Silwood1]
MDEDSLPDTTDPVENIPEIAPNEVETLAYQHLIDRLEEIENLPTTDAQMKRDQRSQFVAVWSEILQIPPSDAPSCYQKCASLLSRLFKQNQIHIIRANTKIAREMCFACISQLTHSNISRFLKLKTEQQNLPDNRILKKHIFHLLRIAAQTITLIPFSKVDDRQFIENHFELYTVLIEHIEQSMPEHGETKVEQGHILGDIALRALNLLWNTTDRTVLVPLLLRNDFVKKLLGWLAQASKLADTNNRPLISIVLNIARHDDGADELNKYGAIDIIKEYMKIKPAKPDNRSLAISMTLALLSTPEELKRDTKDMNNVLNRLLQLVIDCSKNNRFRHEGFHVSEPLVILVKMFVVDERTLEYVLCHAETKPPSDPHSTIRLFITLLFKFTNALDVTNQIRQYTLISLLNIIWSISFQPNYASELTQDEQLMSIIKKFANDDQGKEVLEDYKPRSMEGVKEAVHGILHNLNRDFKTDMILEKKKTYRDARISDSTTKIQQKPSIMVSYSHENNDFCTHVLEVLNKHNDVFNIWIDRTHCQGAYDLWESIADGMEQASVIVCLLSNQYFESKSCRKEFIYATDSLKKKLVPILIEQFEPRGWLGIRMTGIKYVRFRGAFGSEQNKIIELSNTILATLSPQTLHDDDSYPLHLSHHVVSLPSPPSPPPQQQQQQHQQHLSSTNSIQQISIVTLRLFNQWTSTGDDINQWFAYHRLSNKLRDLYDFQTGEEMREYAKILVKDREKQMHIYERLFSKKYNGEELPPHEFNRFALALEKLLRENLPPTTTTNPSTSKNSSTCIIL